MRLTVNASEIDVDTKGSALHGPMSCKGCGQPLDEWASPHTVDQCLAALAKRVATLEQSTGKAK